MRAVWLREFGPPSVLDPGDAPEPAGDVIATLPKGARIVSTGVAGDRLVVTLDIGGVTEIRTFDAHTLRPAGKLKFANEP